MKTITFPEPVHEQAINIMSRARSELEALGYNSYFTSKMCGDALNQGTLNAHFEVNMTANIEIKPRID